MIRRGVFALGFLALLFVGLLTAGAFMLVRTSRGGADQAAYSAGYAAGLAAAGANDGDATAPVPPPAGQYFHTGAAGIQRSWGWSPFGFFGGIFKFFFLVLLLGMVMRLLSFGHWRRGPGWGHGRHGHHSPHGPGPHHEKRPEDVEPTISQA